MAMRSSDDNDSNEIKRRRDRATTTRLSDGDEIDGFSLTKQTRSKLETSKCRILSKKHKLFEEIVEYGFLPLKSIKV
ncbi:hypothetical protein DY000_02033333 [Brassica cretica]|uniref:Uncharacterized protein n=1 Tax=Brassica cretica TaxID=69181 RepID=A0ABQ7DM10_BRACR|nr:hypothetical protein DY000_02033333 [Brassica cretica]